LGRHEGVLRWGLGFCGLLLLSSAAFLTFLYVMAAFLAAWRGGQNWWVYEFHAFYLTIHGCGLALGVLLFSRAKNSTYLRLPLCCGGTSEASRLDTAAFLLFALLSTAASIATPYYFERACAAPIGQTVFPDLMHVRHGRAIDFARIAVEGSVVISVAGFVVYAFHRLACLLMWIKSAAFVGVAALYLSVVCMLPVFIGMVFLEVPELRDVQPFARWAPMLAMASPITVVMSLFNEMGSRFPRDVSAAPFYVVHGVLLGVTIFEIRRCGRRLRMMYLARPVRETR
jgi:hypothetical protein